MKHSDGVTICDADDERLKAVLAQVGNAISARSRRILEKGIGRMWSTSDAIKHPGL